MLVQKKIAHRFENYIFDWDYEQYLIIGGYGSSKSYNTAFKIILKLLQEKRRALVVREVYETIIHSCYDLFVEILDDMDMFTDNKRQFTESKTKVLGLKSPMQFKFPNGSSIIFKGMDKPAKIKSINGVSIVWMEEATEVKYGAYKELLGRLRTPNVSMHFIMTCNPDKQSWVYRHFFIDVFKGRDIVKVDPEDFYKKKTMIHKGVYYMHSIPTDNPFLPLRYIKRLDAIMEYDRYLYTVARWGKFGTSGTRVLPQFMVATKRQMFINEIRKLGDENKYFGFDFGFEKSYNAIISMAVDLKREILYIYDEIYINHVTDSQMAKLDQMQKMKEELNRIEIEGHEKYLVCDNEDPKAIQYYRDNGFKVRACKNKFAGSRLSNTRKVKRFKKIMCSPKCVNTIAELKELTYKEKSNGDLMYDDFTIDPHTFSAIWYGLDLVNIKGLKEHNYSVDGK
jgi:phage terminase, large subunit, PBSX family